MAIVKTVRIVSENPKYDFIVINKADFHSGKHKLFDPSAPKKKEPKGKSIKNKISQIKKVEEREENN